MALPDIVGTERLQRQIGIGRLVGGVVVHENRCLVGHHFPDNGRNALALCEPLPPDLRQHLRRVGLVEQDRTGGPAIGHGQPVQVVQDSWERSRRETGDGQGFQEGIAQFRLQTARSG
jgi:hypothetical protein